MSKPGKETKKLKIHFRLHEAKIHKNGWNNTEMAGGARGQNMKTPEPEPLQISPVEWARPENPDHGKGTRTLWPGKNQENCSAAPTLPHVENPCCVSHFQKIPAARSE